MNDLRFAFRRLLKNPGFTTVAVVTLALGIGANTAMFSPLNTLLFRALPYAQPAQLVGVFRTSPHSQSWPHSPGNFSDYREQNAVFEHLAVYRRSGERTRAAGVAIIERGDVTCVAHRVRQVVVARIGPAKGVRDSHGTWRATLACATPL